MHFYTQFIKKAGDVTSCLEVSTSVRNHFEKDETFKIKTEE